MPKARERARANRLGQEGRPRVGQTTSAQQELAHLQECRRLTLTLALVLTLTLALTLSLGGASAR